MGLDADRHPAVALPILQAVYIKAVLPPPRSDPAKSHDSLPNEIPLRACSAAVLVGHIRQKGPANFTAIKRAPPNALRKAPGKDSLKSKRLIAAWDETFLARTLRNL